MGISATAFPGSANVARIFSEECGKSVRFCRGRIPDLRGDASPKSLLRTERSESIAAKLNSRSQMIMIQMKYACPVCGYGGLYRPPRDYYTCPCCGTEFGYDDYAQDPQELRRRWVASG